MVVLLPIITLMITYCYICYYIIIMNYYFSILTYYYCNNGLINTIITR